MEESREESIVSMLKPTEISLPLSTVKNPNKWHCFPEDSSMGWYNFENSKTVKACGCNECGDFIRKPDSSQDFQPLKKHGRLETAISSDSEFGRQECEKEYKSSGQVQGRITIRKKRSTCLYLPEDNKSFENSVLHPELLHVPPSPFMTGNSSLKLTLSDGQTSSLSTKCDSSATDLEDQERDEMSQKSGDVKEKKLKLKEELDPCNFDRRPFFLPCGKTNILSKNGRHDMNGPLNLIADPEDHTGDGLDTKTGENLAFEVEKLTQSGFIGNHLEHTSTYLDPVMDTALIDVHLTVKASCRVENVPYVCLTSQLNGKAILGYPLEIGEMSNSSETLLPRNESVSCKLFSDEGSICPRLAWRTSKRTPVCYVTNSLFSSISKNVQTGRVSKNVKEKHLKKLLKNPSHCKQGRAALSRTCVPVEYIFSKILGAVGQVQH